MKELSRRTFMRTAGCFATLALVSPMSAFAATTADGWEILGEGSQYVSWGVGKSGYYVAQVIAGVISGISGIGVAGVIAVVGISALGDISNAAAGGTVYYSWQMKYVPLTTPQYRCVLTLKTASGESFGPYYCTTYSVVDDTEEVDN